MGILAEFFNNNDTNWVNRAFLLPSNAIAQRDSFMARYSDASLKYTDGSLGGNYAINQPPQYTRTADIKSRRIVDIANDAATPRTGGMGRYYSDAIDDHQELVYFRMGVPAFNSLTTWYTGFYDVSLGKLAATGRSGGFGTLVGHVGGLIFGSPIIIMQAVATTLSFLFNRQPSQYMYLKPTMHPYWETVTAIVNELSVNLNLTPTAINGGPEGGANGNTEWFEKHNTKRSYLEKIGVPGDNAWDFYSKLLPKEFHPGNSGVVGLDVKAIATKAHRLTYAWNERVKAILEDSYARHGSDLDKALAELLALEQQVPDDPGPGGLRKSGGEGEDNIGGYTYNNSINGQPIPIPADIAINEGADGSNTSELVDSSLTMNNGQKIPAPSSIWEDAKSLWGDTVDAAGEILNLFRAQEQDAGEFVCFRVDNLGSASFSVSNSSKESGLSQTLNGQSASIREKFFNFANGNLGDTGGFIGTAGAFAEGALKFAANATLGMANVMGLGGIGMLGNAFVDLPQMYDNSSTSLPTANLSIKLRSPYGNDLSRLKNILLPSAMLMAMSFPRSTGGASYNGPFMLEAYSRGRFQVRLGMVKSFSMTLGVGNVPFNKDKKPLGIDIDISIEEMGGITHIPIAQSASPLDVFDPSKAVTQLFNEDSRYKDMLAIMSSMSLHSQIYQIPKLMRNWEKTKVDWSTWFTWSNMASAFRGSTVGTIASLAFTTQASVF